MSEYRPLHCAGCGRQVGVAKRDATIFCDYLCVEQPKIGQNETRDALIRDLARVERKPLTAIAASFGITKQRVNQILATSYR